MIFGAFERGGSDALSGDCSGQRWSWRERRRRNRGPDSARPGAGRPSHRKAVDEFLGNGRLGWARKYDAQGRMREADYRQELARRIAAAEGSSASPWPTATGEDPQRDQRRPDRLAQADTTRAAPTIARSRPLAGRRGWLSAGGWAKQRVELAPRATAMDRQRRIAPVFGATGASIPAESYLSA